MNGFNVTMEPGDVGIPVPVPDSGLLTVPTLGLEIAVTNDTGATWSFLTFSFTTPEIIPDPLALTVASPDLGLDPPAGPDFFDLTGPGTFELTVGMDTGIPDDLDDIADATFIILYAPDPFAGAPNLEFSGVSLRAVPEPAAPALILAALCSLAALRRRK